MSHASTPPIEEGTIINDRYEIRRSLGKGGMGEVFLAYDRSTQQQVALKVVRADARMPGDDEALRQELLHARTVGHPNVCRVHDLAPSPWGPILVMEHIEGRTLHSHIRRRKGKGGYTGDEFRKLASEISGALAAIHEQELVHGDLKPGNVMVTDSRAIILDFGFAQERARVFARRPGSPPDGGTPNYMAPERLRSGGASPEDDVYALGLTLWEMWTARVPEPGSKPRKKPMREQLTFDVPSQLSVDEVKQIFMCLSENPRMRPRAKHLRFFNPARRTVSPVQVPRVRLDPGPPLPRANVTKFAPNAQGVLVTYATNTPEVVGSVIPLSSANMTIGRRPDRDILLPEPTVSGAHAIARWGAGTWTFEDLGSTNGTYVEHNFDRMPKAVLMHGGEVQLGELRLRLVSFAPGSEQHKNARRFLSSRDGLTGLLKGEHFMQSLREEAAFSDWADVPLTVARYSVRGPHHQVSERATILELLSFRRAAQRCVELTETLLLSMTPVLAGTVHPLEFYVAIAGPTTEEATALVEQVKAQVQNAIPLNVQLHTAILEREAHQPVESLIR